MKVSFIRERGGGGGGRKGGSVLNIGGDSWVICEIEERLNIDAWRNYIISKKKPTGERG